MKKWFVFGLLGLVLFEAANVYFIMPMPGSQRAATVDVAYALHRWRWVARALVGAMIVAGAGGVWRAGGWRRGVGVVLAAIVGAAAWLANARLAADRMFYQPTSLIMAPAERNAVAPDRLVVGVVRNGEARAYPIQFIGYHHQVRDRVGGEPVLVSYCTVCRTARVFSPIVDGTEEAFRLVGMDHWNAMFEDGTTGSWWRQANGVAIAGPRKGRALPEIASQQVTLTQWLASHPASLVMQPDPAFVDQYPPDYAYENGTSRRALTGTDAASWGDKSWVVGLVIGDQSKAYDWNRLRRERLIHDRVGQTPIVLALADDLASFFAYERPSDGARFTLVHDTLVADGVVYTLAGKGPSSDLVPVRASQEFWHSWRTFHPETLRDE